MNYWVKCLKYLHESGRLRYSEFIRIQLKCIVLVVIASIATVLFPNLVSRIIDYGIESRQIQNIYKYSIWLGITGITMIVSEYAYQMGFYRFSQRVVMEIKEMFFEKLLKTNIKFWSNHTAGDMFKILEDDIAAIENMFTRSISSIISNVFILVGVVSYLIYIHKLIGVILISLTLIITFVQRRYGKKIEALIYPLRDDVAQFSSYTNETLNNIINIEMCGNSKKIYMDYCQKNNGIVKKTLLQLRMVTFLRSVISSYSVCGMFVVMLIGAHEAITGNMSVGSLVSLTMYIQWLLSPVASLGDAYVEFKSNLPIFKRIFNVMDSEDIIYKGNIFPHNKLTGKIELQNISFKYNHNREVFHDFSLTVKPGETLGITGKNGSGKTTIFRLLMKLCEVQQGKILIDGTKIRDYDVEYLTKQIGCLLQNEFMISGELRKIIDIEGSHTDQEISRIMSEFGLNINEFPEGLDTWIEENKSNLSGGQVQKIALARLFLQDKAVYLLDEPTSAIDINSEEKICHSIKKYLNQKSAIVITHREKILSICDRKIQMPQKGN